MPDYEYIQTPAALEGLVTRLLQHPEMTLALDTETTGLDPLARNSRVLLCQIATPEAETFVINAAKVDLRPLQPVFAGRRVAVLQNAKFDIKWLWQKYGLRVPHVFDTMLAELLLNAGTLEHPLQRRKACSLRALAKRYLDVELDKEVRKEFIGFQGREFSGAQLAYAAADVPILFTLKEIQARELQHAGLIEVANLEFKTIYPVARMELNGLGIDREQYAAVIDESREKMQEVDAEIRHYLLKKDVSVNLFEEVDINLNSPPQVLAAFRLLGETMDATDVKALKRSRHPFAEMMLRYREFETQVSTFGVPVLNCIHPVDGRIHCNFDQLGTDSGRFSASNPNLQQIPKADRFRSNFISRPGNRMVVGDWSQFELRILCFYSGDEHMLAAFHAGRDLHSDTASRMYDLPYAEITKHHPARADAKILNFALAYGMGPTSMADDMKCTVDKAKEKMERYFASYPGVKRYLAESAKQGVRCMETRTVSGRRRLFVKPEPGEDYRKQIASIQRKSKNTPIQGSNGDALKRAMIMVQRHLEARQVTPGLVACVHDEIVLEVPEGEAEWAREMLESEMVAAGTHYLPGVPIKVDVGVASCWTK